MTSRRSQFQLTFRYLFYLTLIMLGNLPNVAIAQNKYQLTIGVDGSYPPFAHKNIEGEFFGLDIDLANLICKKAKLKCSFVDVGDGDLVQSLLENRIDIALSAINILDQSKQIVDFSLPYLQLSSAVVVLKDSIITDLSAENLRDAQLGVLHSSPHSEYVNVHLPQSTQVNFKLDTDYFIALANNRLDAVVADPISVNYWVNSPDGDNCCRLLGYLAYDPLIHGEGFGIAIRKNDNDLREKIDMTLSEIRKTGELAKLISSHLPFLN